MLEEYQGIAIAFADREEGTPSGLMLIEQTDKFETRMTIKDETGKIITFFWFDSELLETLIAVVNREIK